MDSNKKRKRKTLPEKIEKTRKELTKLECQLVHEQTIAAHKSFSKTVNKTRGALKAVNDIFKKIDPATITFAARADDLDYDKTPLFAFEVEGIGKFSSKSKLAKLYDPILKERDDLAQEEKDFVIDYVGFMLPSYLKAIRDGATAAEEQWVEMEEVYAAIEEM